MTAGRENRMSSGVNKSSSGSRSVTLRRQLLTCPACGWVHYAMTREEKTANDRFLTRYQLTEQERSLYESAFRQCLQCEAPAHRFRAAEEEDIARAAGHLVTPVYVEATFESH
jgi:hypothetical protein